MPGPSSGGSCAARVSDSVREALVRIACRSLTASSGGDDELQALQSEIAKLQAANLLPRDFTLESCRDQKDGGAAENDEAGQTTDLKACAAQLVEEIICKVTEIFPP